MARKSVQAVAKATPPIIKEEETDLAPLGEFIGYLLWRAQTSVFENLVTHLKEFELRPIQFSILAIVERHPGLRQNDVSAALGVRPSNFVGLVDELERGRLIKRRRNAEDRRAQTLHLTEHGRKAMARLNYLHNRHQRSIDEAIGPEGRRALVDLLSALRRIND